MNPANPGDPTNPADLTDPTNPTDPTFHAPSTRLAHLTTQPFHHPTTYHPTIPTTAFVTSIDILHHHRRPYPRSKPWEMSHPAPSVHIRKGAGGGGLFCVWAIWAVYR